MVDKTDENGTESTEEPTEINQDELAAAIMGGIEEVSPHLA